MDSPLDWFAAEDNAAAREVPTDQDHRARDRTSSHEVKELRVLELPPSWMPTVPIVRSDTPLRRHRRARVDTFKIVAIAAITSAAVSALTTWMLFAPSGEVQAVVADAVFSASEPQAPLAGRDLRETPAPAPPKPIQAALAVVPNATPRATKQPRAMRGNLVVVTQPAGARVTVDGVAWGVTPVTIRHLSPGDKRVRVTKEGYAGEERRVRLTDGRPGGTVRIALRSVP